VTTFLVGISYHEPEAWALHQKGVLEDFESSTGLFVEAETAEQAKSWGDQVGQALLRSLNADDSLDWKGLGYFSWIETDLASSGWQHCLDFFQSVKVGEWPDPSKMGTEPYLRWAAEHGIAYG
jgi:hypothetical protein